MSSRTVYATLLSVVVLISAAGLILDTDLSESANGTEDLRIPSLYEGVNSTYEDFEYIESDGKITITGYLGSGGVITIPSEIPDVGIITGIGTGAFENKGIRGLVIPASITHIDDYAFSNNATLGSIEIKNSEGIDPNDITIGDSYKRRNENHKMI
mgnify:FL=1